MPDAAAERPQDLLAAVHEAGHAIVSIAIYMPLRMPSRVAAGAR